MNNFTYENQGAESLLIYQLGAEEHLDSLAKGMLQGNEMEGILRPSFTQHDREQYLKYPVTSRIPLRDFVSGEMERSAVLKLCLSVVSAVKEIEEYMLSPKKLVMDLNYIFVDVRKKSASLVYLPVDEFSQEETLKEFLLGLLSHMRFQLDQDVSYVAKLIHFLNQPKALEYDALKHYIENLMVEQNGIASGYGLASGRTLGAVEVSAEHKMQCYGGGAEEQEYYGADAAGQGRYGAGVIGQESYGAAAESGRTSVRASGLGQAVGSPGVSQPPIPVPASVPETAAMPVNPAPQNTEAKKKKLGWLGKKKKAEKTSEMAETPQIPGGSAASGAPAIPGVPAIPGAPAIPGVPAAPGVLSSGSAGQSVPEPAEALAEKKKKGLFGRGKKKEPKPPIVPISSVNPAAALQPSIPFVPAAKTDDRSMQPQSAPPSQPQGGGTVYMSCGSSNEGNRTVIMGGGEDYRSTVLLGGAVSGGTGEVRQTAKIIRKRTGQSMVIHQDSFRIGSEGSFVDFYITDNPAIGGCHADIARIDGAWYITDRNSANHTYVNGIMVQPMQSVQLGSRTVITLADEDFDFIIN